MKKKLLIFTDTYSTQVNGVQTSLRALIEHLSSCLEIIIISADDFRKVPYPTDPEILLSLVSREQIMKIIEKNHPDYIHIATEGTIGFASARACQKLGYRYTSAFHTKFPEYINIRIPIIQKKWVHKALLSIHKYASRIIVSNSLMKQYLLENGYPREKIRTLHFGVDHTLFSPGEKTLFLDLPKPILLFVGRVAVEKNIRDFLLIDHPGTKLVVGDGPLRTDLEREFPEVHFLGFRKKEELVDIYRSADLFVFPSLTDTFGLVNVEALACGLPVLAYDVDGPNAVIKNGKNGVLVPYRENLASHVEKALTIAPRDCIRSASLYDWGRFAKKFIKEQVTII